MGLQDEWSVETAINVGKMNNMTNIGGTGTYLTGSITKRKGMIVISYDTSGGMTQWHQYVWDDVAIAWVDLTLPQHTHMDATTGGEFYLVPVFNPNSVWFNDLYPTTAHWVGNVASGTGSSIANNAGVTVNKIIMATGTTTTGYVTLWTGGMTIDFAYQSRFQLAFQISAITNILFRFGLGVEDPNVASNNNNKIGIEWCDAQITSNYYTLSGNGTTRSLVDSGVAMAAGVTHGVRMIYYPASKAEYKFWNGTIYNKTGILPSGSCLNAENVRIGAKNNNGGSANRNFENRGCFASGRVLDPVWVANG